MSVRKLRRKLKSGKMHERWVVDIGFLHPDGRLERIRRVPRIQTRVGAERLEREILNKLEAGPTSPEKPDVKPKEEVPTLSEFWPDFLSHHVTVNNKPSERHAKLGIFKNHLLPAFGAMRLSEISARDIERYKAAKLDDTAGKAFSAKSINNQLAVLRTILRTAMNWQVILSVPFYREIKLPEQTMRYLTPEESFRLIQAADGQFQVMVALALNTGLRIGELIGLKWTDIDLEIGRLVVNRNDWKGIIGLPKGGKRREIPLNGTATRYLKSLIPASFEWVFHRTEGSRLTHAICRRPIHKACRLAALEPFQWHTLRHTFAAQLVSKGVSLRAVQILLGHANQATTERYAHLTPHVTKDAVRVLENFNNFQ